MYINPKDFEVDDDRHVVGRLEILGRRAKYHEKDEPLEMWMGDHSHSWLTADEILSAPPPERVWQTGIVTRKWFDSWDGQVGPESWSGGISGGGIFVAESPTAVTDESTHVRIWWIKPGDTLKYFTDEVRRLKDLHGEVRLVFGFDS